MMDTIYFDTSAPAKWYLNEEKSDDVTVYIAREIDADVLATVDRNMAMAGEAMGLSVERFFAP
jgi:predicted nucleic acid-binding protein